MVRDETCWTQTKTTGKGFSFNTACCSPHLILPTLHALVVLLEQLQPTDQRCRRHGRLHANNIRPKLGCKVRGGYDLLVDARLLDESLDLQQHLSVGYLAHDAKGVGAEGVVGARHVFV